MSAKERAEKTARAHDRRRETAEMEGMRQALTNSDGRALISWITTQALTAEGKGAKQLRQLGRDILLAATLANWEGVQIMREEWERPRLGARAEAETEEEGGE